MKCLSLWQPWVSLIAVGDKRVETRSWQTAYRGPLVIHAAKTQTKEAKEFMAEAQFVARYPKLGPGYTFHYGAIVAVAELARVVRMADLLPGEISAHEETMGWYTPDRYAWFLEGVRVLPTPLPMTGHQGLWSLTREAEAMVYAAIDGL